MHLCHLRSRWRWRRSLSHDWDVIAQESIKQQKVTSPSWKNTASDKISVSYDRCSSSLTALYSASTRSDDQDATDSSALKRRWRFFKERFWMKNRSRSFSGANSLKLWIKWIKVRVRIISDQNRTTMRVAITHVILASLLISCQGKKYAVEDADRDGDVIKLNPKNIDDLTSEGLWFLKLWAYHVDVTLMPVVSPQDVPTVTTWPMLIKRW